jgi:glycine/D-amino acid oxidase-like deaminating enzyme
MSTVTNTADVVIIWGLSTAWHLARQKSGQSIVVLERNSQLADETTRQAAGQIGQLRSDPLMAEAVRYTLELYTGFAEETGHDPHIVRTGSLHLAHCVERMAAFQAQLDSAKTFGVDVQIADSNLISKIAPTVNQSEIVGALHVPGDGQTMPRA